VSSALQAPTLVIIVAVRGGSGSRYAVSALATPTRDPSHFLAAAGKDPHSEIGLA